MKLIFSNLFYTLFFSLLAASAILYMLDYQYTKDGPLRAAKIINIGQGDSLIEIGDNLAQNGIIENKLLFLSLVKIKGLSNKIKYGEYLVEESISIRSLLENLSKGVPLQRKVLIPEGLTSNEISQILNSDPRIKGPDVKIASEGVFAPDTYSFDMKISKYKLLEIMKEQQDRIVEIAWSKRERDLPLKTSKELVILASMVEKEAIKNNEKPIIASVFINRINRNMRLQSDPTVIYALTKGKTKLGRKLTRKDLKRKSEFNTYKVFGLPPTPICNPGRLAIMAVSQPAKTDYLYFVADGKGGHKFSRNLDEHINNVSEYRKMIKNK